MPIKQYAFNHFAPKWANNIYVGLFENTIMPDVVEFPHKHNYYELLWIKEGSGIQGIDFQKRTVKPNSLYFISPNQLHLFQNWKSIKGYYLIFTEDALQLQPNNKQILQELKYFDNLYFNAEIHLNTPSKQHIFNNLFELIKIEQENQNSKHIISDLLMLILKNVSRFANNDKPYQQLNKAIKTHTAFLKLLNDHYTSNWTAIDYAEELAVSVHTLNRVSKEFTNKNTTLLISERKIFAAQKMLIFESVSVSEIAFRLGFEDSSYFSKQFRKKTGKSALAFKAEMYKKYRTNYFSS